jgi:hypothetical protein
MGILCFPGNSSYYFLLYLCQFIYILCSSVSCYYWTVSQSVSKKIRLCASVWVLIVSMSYDDQMKYINQSISPVSYSISTAYQDDF